MCILNMRWCHFLILLCFLVASHSLRPRSRFSAQIIALTKLYASSKRLDMAVRAAEPENASATACDSPAAPASEGVAYGANNFGDIMGGCETHVVVDGTFTPLERVVLTANGNLQRIMSAYYGAPVTVKVRRCDRVGDGKFGFGLYDREVDLVADGRVFCTAVGRIELQDASCAAAVEGGKVGLGQLFRYLGALPKFVLLEAGKQDGVLWRCYSLSCAQLQCEFTERFAVGFLDVRAAQ